MNLTSLFFPSGTVDLREEAVLLVQGCKFRGMPVMAVLQMCQRAVLRSSRAATFSRTTGDKAHIKEEEQLGLLG